jgi:hypothetical protein
VKEPVWDGFMFEVPGFHDEVFWDWKDVITASEMQILKRLGFQMQVSRFLVAWARCSARTCIRPGEDGDGAMFRRQADNRWTCHIVM